MTVAHLGVAIFVIGVTLVKGYETERDLRMAPGRKRRRSAATSSPSRARRKCRARTTRRCAASSRCGARARTLVRTMRPEKRVYHAAGQTMTEAAIDTGLARDLYVSLGEPVGDGAWGVRVYHKPFVDWIWGGCLHDGAGRLPRALATAATAAQGRDGARSAPRPPQAREAHEGAQVRRPARASSSALAAFLAVGLTRDPREVPSPFIGKPAPAFELEQLHDAAAARSRPRT